MAVCGGARLLWASAASAGAAQPYLPLHVCLRLAAVPPPQPQAPWHWRSLSRSMHITGMSRDVHVFADLRGLAEQLAPRGGARHGEADFRT